MRKIPLLMLLMAITNCAAPDKKPGEEPEPVSFMLGLRTVAYKVADLDSASKWYTAVFGVEPYFDEPYYVGFNIRGYELGLLPADSVDHASKDNVTVYWGVENIETASARFSGLGARIIEPAVDVGDGIITASFEDPWGNAIGIIYNPGFKVKQP